MSFLVFVNVKIVNKTESIFKHYNMKWGLISKLDSEVLMKTIDLICQEFPGQEINTCCIGIFDGDTDRSIYEYVTGKGYGSASINPSMGTMRNNNYKCNHTAIDNEKDKLIKLPFPECKFIRGNSNEVYNQIPDNSQNLIFVDGCHCFAHVVSDFFCYAPKVKVGGYLAFHDTGTHIKEFKDFQHGDKSNPDAYISVRKALDKIGLFNQNAFIAVLNREKHNKEHWLLVFDEADPTDEAGGICVFKKLY